MLKEHQIIIKKTVHIVSSMLFYAVILLMLLFVFANANMRSKSDIAHVFGSGFHSIENEYILDQRNNSFVSNDIALVKIVDDQLVAELKIGDIVTYYDEEAHQFVTHRIVEIDTIADRLFFTTQGEQSIVADEPIEAKKVLAVYQSSIVGLGSVLDYLQSPEGYMILVIFPVFIMLLFEGMNLYNNLFNFSKSKSEARVQKTYKKILKNLESETVKIRHQIMSNWISEKDYESIVKIRI